MKRLIYIILISFISILGFGQSPQIKVTIAPNIITPNTTFQITYAITGGNISSFQPPSFRGLSVVGQNQFNQSSFVNGVVSQEIKFIYSLTAASAGKYSIEPARAKVGNSIIQSQQLQFDVVASKPQNQNKSNNNGGNNNVTDNSQDLFIKATLNKSSANVGEQLILTYKLYTRISVSQYAMDKAPSNKGFWSQNLMKDNEQPKQYEEVINGQKYIVAEIRKVSLVPQQGGKLSIEPLKVECLVREKVKRKGNSFFEEFFNDPFFDNSFNSTQNVKRTVLSNAVTLNVQSLPTANQPSNFTGAVGKFQIEANIDKTKVNTNDAITLKIKISGTGNLQLIDDPKLTFPSDFETYDPKSSEQISTTAAGMTGYKMYEYVLIPRAAGKFTIPSYSFSYFDLSSKSYKTINTQSFDIEVNKGANSNNTTIVSSNQKDIKYLGSDIRYIKTNNSTLNSINSHFFNSGIFWLIFIIPFALFIIVFIILQKLVSEQGNLSLMRNKKATKIAKKRLALAEKYMKDKNNNSFYIELSKAVWGYIGDKFDISQSQLSLDNVNETFRNSNITNETIHKIIETLNEIEFSRFSPSTENSQTEYLYKQSIDLILKIENELKQ